VADVAVVVVAYNTRDHLRVCLSSLADSDAASRGIALSVWVVDNASRDGSAAMVRDQFEHVQLVTNTRNVGYAAANNKALQASGFKPLRDGPTPAYVLLLNPDTVVQSAAIGDMVHYAQQRPDVGVVGPKLVLEDGRLDLACRRSFPTPEVSFYRLVGLSRLFPSSRRFGRYNLTYLDPDRPAEVDSVVGACMLVRGEAIHKVGLLDERFFMYGEDLDWCLRIKRAGWRVYYWPEAQVVHRKRASSRSSARARYEFQRAMYLFYRKHYAASTARPLHWLVMAGLAARGGPRLMREMLRPDAVLSAAT
jgi:hypothetical protein